MELGAVMGAVIVASEEEVDEEEVDEEEVDEEEMPVERKVLAESSCWQQQIVPTHWILL
jgi:hypothetical protein